ncbi:MAG: cell division protein FtsA [Maribacter dokdonensis]|uniref:Cell division protein FtsA n=2 Tax=Maribacter dokdonensis TaxID=320912 RepID=A0A1H4JFH8_9FLAO|nr:MULTISPECIES: cell division protein FtsA [Maribacter]APA63541.1 cell division protein FtsA [Maribacter sp. 1_2014MBL_MicDiv]KSA11597.1 Cell division protein FtsA [Maribacter dokdonensis DSW-8]MBU2899546.1 cell division protein FtsA [Maribacter dokdonensis]MDP2527628.1 cell division protein FtsA [Maribacter dokdonensis]SDR88908.1 cell division protein FtsA [Maribacter dokdonensis]|tara:strand:- start:51189 stop:52523 length:1335 start_codon:yes stop_codon:yes gene_type:complete
MEQTKYSVGLDIGTTKIVAIIGKQNEYGKIEILGIGKSKSLGVHRGVVNNITQTIKSIQQAVEEAEANSGLKIGSVVVGIAGQHIRSLQHSDYITRKDSEEVIGEDDVDMLCGQVHKLIMLPGEEIIHVLPQEYKVDGQAEIREPIGMYGGRLEANFHVVVGQVVSIKNVGRCIKSAGLDLGNITLEPLASSDAVLSQEEKEAGVALIDIGGGTTDLAIFKDGIIRHTAVIPFGGGVITEDIKEGCSIIEKQAELLKTRFGSAWPGENRDNEIVSIPGLRGREPKEISLKNLSKIIHARVVEIIEQVYVEIKNYGHEEQKKKLIAGIVLTGGGSQLKHLKQLVEYITGMDTRIGYPNEHLAGDSDEEVASPLYATAVGLLMNAIKNQEKLKLTQEEIIQEQEEEELVYAEHKTETVKRPDIHKERKSVFDKWTEKLKEFLDNAE